jgi:predicted nucleic acid-binding protein
MRKLFLDTNVILDFLGNRKPFAEHAAIIFDQAEKGKLSIYVSALSFSNLYYILHKATNHKKAMLLITTLNDLVNVVKVDQQIIDEAINSGFKDFEDAIQDSCAAKIKQLDALITRNLKDFKNSKVSTLSPKAAAAFILS